MSEIKRFIQMEENYLKVDKAVQAFKVELEEFQKILPLIQQLDQYYGSNEWIEHQQLEQEENIDYPTTAVLGEDYAYNTLSDVRTIALEMLETATNLLKTS